MKRFECECGDDDCRRTAEAKGLQGLLQVRIFDRGIALSVDLTGGQARELAAELVRLADEIEKETSGHA